ncbi:MAG: 50S ribosomal protein L6 [Clostridia bacterium]|nr:50S ribosomal protein L6 [Clostridia bacterium]
MSRIGRQPVQIPAGVEIKISNDNVVTVKGPKGELSRAVNPVITVKVENNEVVCTRANEEAQTKAMHGLYRKLIANMVEGVTNGYSKTLVVNGVGYRAFKEGNKVMLDVGFSHNVPLDDVAGITYEVANGTEVTVKGIDKELVGQIAANIRSIRIPDPYHAYGISYKDEVIPRKEGKKGKK